MVIKLMKTVTFDYELIVDVNGGVIVGQLQSSKLENTVLLTTEEEEDTNGKRTKQRERECKSVCR